MKVVTSFIGSPDEIINALMNEKKRAQWDPTLKIMVKQQNKYKITY